MWLWWFNITSTLLVISLAFDILHVISTYCFVFAWNVREYCWKHHIQENTFFPTVKQAFMAIYLGILFDDISQLNNKNIFNSV